MPVASSRPARSLGGSCQPKGRLQVGVQPEPTVCQATSARFDSKRRKKVRYVKTSHLGGPSSTPATTIGCLCSCAALLHITYHPASITVGLSCEDQAAICHTPLTPHSVSRPWGRICQPSSAHHRPPLCERHDGSTALAL